MMLSYRLFSLFCFILLISSSIGNATTNEAPAEKTLLERVRGEQYPTLSKEVPPKTLEARKPPALINGAFGMGKNFHGFRAGFAFSPMMMPEGWQRWEFYLEFAFYVLHRRIYNPRKLYIATITPFFRYRFDPWSKYDPYWDIGCGGAYRDKKKFGNIPISTNLSFHILTALGLYPFGNTGPSLSVRWYHFSNAKIKVPNNGIDLHVNVALEYPL